MSPGLSTSLVKNLLQLVGLLNIQAPLAITLAFGVRVSRPNELERARGLIKESWQTPMAFLVIASIAVPIGLSTWQALINNYAVEQVGFTGLENGLMQSFREVPGFLAFTTVFFLLAMREQTFAVLALATFGLGITITGLLPSVIGLYCAVVLMSFGFHYFETVKAVALIAVAPQRSSPQIAGSSLLSVGSVSALLTFLCILALVEGPKLFGYEGLDFLPIFAVAGGIVLALVIYLQLAFPKIESSVPQRKHLVMRARYWLYFVLTFFSGARRQIFVAFAGFLLVEKFGYSLTNITVLLLVNHFCTWLFAERIGRLIGVIGEKRALTIEYVGLVFVFIGYAFVDSAVVAGGLYVVDNLMFALAIAIKTYFQKIADPADIAGTASVALTINHVLAVIIPAVLGFVWLSSRSAVFLIGAGLALISLCLSQLIPRQPRVGNEYVLIGNSTSRDGVDKSA